MIEQHGGGYKVRIFLLIEAAVLCSLQGTAQPRIGPIEREAGPQAILFEAVSLPIGGDSLHGRVDVQYRIDREFFVPVRNPEGDSLTMFQRRGDILVELFDTTGTAAGRALHHIAIPEENAERRPSGSAWEQGILSITVPPGTYHLHLTVDDLESKREFIDKKVSIKVPAKNTGDHLATAFLIEPPDSLLPATLAPLDFGGGMLFGKPSALVTIWEQESSDSLVRATISIAQNPPAPEDEQFLPAKTEQPIRLFRGVVLTPSENECRYALTGTPSGRTVMAIVPIATERLLLRSFTFDITLDAGRLHKEIHQSVRAIWPDMPFSLRDINYALDALKYITREEELDSLRQGDLEERRMHLETFWRSKDRSPGTAVNEVMTEYYRRVDHAVRTFGTLRQPDGFRSDRGKVYILYGPPTKTDRMLDPDAGFREVWIYERLNKKFTFADENKSGNYVLVNTSTL
jgi:GWxTD domain-containing protein